MYCATCLKAHSPLFLHWQEASKKRLEPELKDAMDKNRLLLITSFSKKVKRVTSETANQRNRFMAELAGEIFVAYTATGGNLEKLLADISVTGKGISSFKTD